MILHIVANTNNVFTRMSHVMILLLTLIKLISQLFGAGAPV